MSKRHRSVFRFIGKVLKLYERKIVIISGKDIPFPIVIKRKILPFLIPILYVDLNGNNVFGVFCSIRQINTLISHHCFF